MSADTYTAINCDGPGEDDAEQCSNATHLSYPSTAAEVRAVRREDGWRHRRGRDLCPGCWAAGHRWTRLTPR